MFFTSYNSVGIIYPSLKLFLKFGSSLPMNVLNKTKKTQFQGGETENLKHKSNGNRCNNSKKRSKDAAMFITKEVLSWPFP